MDRNLEQAYFCMRPKTYKALQAVVMAAADANSKLGKKSIFGKDKHLPAYNKFKIKLEKLCAAVDIDGDMMPMKFDDSWEKLKRTGDYFEFIDNLINQFKQVYPSWPDAYRYWEEFYKRASAQGVKKY